jgi:hypothetical protein
MRLRYGLRGMYGTLSWAHSCDMERNPAVKMTLATGQPGGGIHVYRVTAANKALFFCTGVASFCGIMWSTAGLIAPHVRTAFGQRGFTTTNLGFSLVFFILGLFSAIRLVQVRLVITDTQIQVIGRFRSKTIPFADIRGKRRESDRRGGNIFLYRHGKSRVWVPQSWLQLDDFYEHWSASIYDLDKADRLKRKADGKEQVVDWFAVDNEEQHPVIGGADITV